MRPSVRSLAITVFACLNLAACAGSPAASVGPSASIAPLPTASAAPVLLPSADLSASSPQPSPSPSPSPSPEPSPSPTPVQTSGEPTHVDGISPGLHAKTIEPNIRVRTKPGVGDDSTKLVPLLAKDVRFYVLDGPVEASGYDWFFVRTKGHDENGQAYPDGWLAAGKDGEPWIKPIAFDCPATPTNLDALRKVASEYRLSCFSGVDITINARVEQTGFECSPLTDIEPAWFSPCTTEFEHNLAALNSIHRFSEFVLTPDADLVSAAEPGAPTVMWPTVELTGHFDDPAAKTCRRATTDADDYLAAITKLYCRNTFVITSMRPS